MLPILGRTALHDTGAPRGRETTLLMPNEPGLGRRRAPPAPVAPARFGVPRRISTEMWSQRLARLAVSGVLSLPATELLEFDSLTGVHLGLLRGVVASLALGAFERDDHSLV